VIEAVTVFASFFANTLRRTSPLEERAACLRATHRQAAFLLCEYAAQDKYDRSQAVRECTECCAPGGIA
jgi:hypothetical protein